MKFFNMFLFVFIFPVLVLSAECIKIRDWSFKTIDTSNQFLYTMSVLVDAENVCDRRKSSVLKITGLDEDGYAVDNKIMNIELQAHERSKMSDTWYVKPAKHQKIKKARIKVVF